MKNSTRLARLEKFHFLMKNFNKIFEPENITFDIGEWKSTSSCGTVACALGAACLVPSFKHAGLRLTEYEIPEFKGEFAGRAGELFFGITADEADDLFYASSYEMSYRDIKPRHVAAKLKELINKYKKPETARDVR